MGHWHLARCWLCDSVLVEPSHGCAHDAGRGLRTEVAMKIKLLGPPQVVDDAGQIAVVRGYHELPPENRTVTEATI